MFSSLSTKQAEIFKFMAEDYDALLCDGAVRSGKTSMMIVAYILWAMENFNDRNFGICGKSVRSAERNIIAPMLQTTSMQKRYSLDYTRSTSILTVQRKGRKNYFYIFGGKDESSYMLIQGITLSGVLFDEVALMPRSFVDQAIARTLSVDNAKLWFNCNPENPNHWFYNEWVLQPEKHNMKRLHFLMEDNPGLSKKAIDRAKASFSGVFYDRYILGKWVVAEGLIYPMFREVDHTFTAPPTITAIAFAVDVGHSNATVFLAIGLGIDGRAYLLREYYHSGRSSNNTKSPLAYAKDFMTFKADIMKQHIGAKLDGIYIDPSALGFIYQLRELGEYMVYQANNDVVPGIQTVSSVIDQDLLRVHTGCTNTLKELGTYSWDKKAAERGADQPVKVDDHAMDALRYYFHTCRRDWIGRRVKDIA